MGQSLTPFLGKIVLSIQGVSFFIIKNKNFLANKECTKGSSSFMLAYLLDLMLQLLDIPEICFCGALNTNGPHRLTGSGIIGGMDML